MVAIKTARVLNGMDMETMVPDYFANIKEKYGSPIYAVHRVDLHNQLKALATGTDGPGQPCKLHVRATVVDYVSCTEDRSPFSLTVADFTCTRILSMQRQLLLMV